MCSLKCHSEELFQSNFCHSSFTVFKRILNLSGVHMQSPKPKQTVFWSMIAIFPTWYLLRFNWHLSPLSSHQELRTTLSAGLSGVKRSAVSWLLAVRLVLYRSRVLGGDKQVNVNVGKQALSRHLLINSLQKFCAHTCTWYPAMSSCFQYP